MAQQANLLLFNLLTDREDPILGFTTEWINALAPCFRKIFVITMAKGVVDVASNVTVYSVGKEQGYSELRRLLRFYQITRQILSRDKIDVCFVHMISIFAVLFFPLALLRRIPVLFWYCHGATPFTLRLAHTLVDRVVTCSADGFRLKSSKVKIIGHGINTDVFKPSDTKYPTDTFRLLTVGRLSPVKHCDILIHAVKKVAASCTDPVSYTIIGGLERSDPAEYQAYLKGLVDDNHLDTVITFKGSVPFYIVPARYREADLFLNASSTGSIDKAVLEAMSSGCMVLTSNPAFKRVLDDLSELLFVPENDPKQFAAAIHKVRALSFDERIKIGSRLREIVLHNHCLEGLTRHLVDELYSLAGHTIQN
ncbi:MAG: glycosyltransferase family 4 protein [Proteobacteria bacterium]|nr:glycosyltransferase family 4 protein [Pseudomonadota bacterium]